MDRDTVARFVATAVQHFVRYTKWTIGFIMFAMLIVLLSWAFATTTPTNTFSNDHFTVANSTDNESVTVTYEVVFEKEGEMNDADRKDAMDSMSLAQSCANERLDEYIETSTASEVRNANFAEITAECDDGQVTIERVGTFYAPTNLSQ